VTSDKTDLVMQVFRFAHYWDHNLKRRLANAEMLGSYSPNTDCKNDILSELINGYVRHAIERTLLSIFEAVKFMRRADNSFSYEESDADPLGLVMAYRNKLLTHYEENKLSGKAKAFADLLQGNEFKIFRDLEKAVKVIEDWVESRVPMNYVVTSTLHSVFPKDDFVGLIKSADSFNLKKE